MFTDKKFEGLDEISKLVEPMVYSVNEGIIAAPERVEVPIKKIASIVSDNRRYSRITSSISSLLSRMNVSLGLPYNEEKKFFKIVAEDEFGEVDKFTVDFLEENSTGKLFIIKHTSSYTDDELHGIMCKRIEEKLRSATKTPSSYDKTRLNEVAEVFDLYDVKRERSSKGKRAKFIPPLVEKIKDQTINIRDVDLGLRFADWIAAYIKRGNLGAIKNLCKLKVMTHNGKGIYSIEDEDSIK